MTAYLDGHPPRAFAHRGWHIDELTGRENSMAAFRRAYDEGFRYLETDVHATTDGQLVAFHDLSLGRVTDGRGQIAALSWAQVRQARIAGTDPIPLMADLLEEFPDARFNIDAKADPAVGPLADLIRRTRTKDRVCIGAFSDRRLSSLRAAVGPEVATSMGPREVFRLVRAARLRRPFVTSAVAAQVPVAFSRVRIVTPAFLDTAHRAGLEVHVWTIDDEDEMRRLLDLGVDGLMSDRPDRLRQVLAERGAW